jgi:DNA-binding response OmpR family regulator
MTVDMLTVAKSCRSFAGPETDELPLDAFQGEETVLLAEDDPQVLAVLSEVLREFQYKVVECSDGDEALGKLKERMKDIDLAILDLVMPNQTGKEIYEEIRKLRRELPVIFISGYTWEIIRNKGVAVEGQTFMSKPVTIDDLLKKVRETLDGRTRD